MVSTVLTAEQPALGTDSPQEVTEAASIYSFTNSLYSHWKDIAFKLDPSMPSLQPTHSHHSLGCLQEPNAESPFDWSAEYAKVSNY